MTLGVTHIISFFESDICGPLSGAENHLLDLLVGSVDAGYDVELIALIHQDGPRLQQALRDLSRAGVTVTKVMIGQHVRRLSLLWRLLQLATVRRRRVVHTHLALASSYGRLAFYLAGCRRIVTSWHNDDPSEGRGFQKIKWRLLDHMTRVNIAITDAVQQHLVARVGLNPAKITRIYYGIVPPKKSMTRDAARAALGLQQTCFTLGFVGRLTAQKNIPLLLDAMAQLPDCDLCLLGAGEELSALQNHAASLGLRNIYFKGFVDHAADMMPAFDLLVLPSRWEGLGLVLLEAMIRHTRVAGSRHGAIPEILGHGAYGFLLDDTDALVTHVKACQSNPASTDHTRAAAFNFAQTLTVPRMVQQTLDLYAKV